MKCNMCEEGDLQHHEFKETHIYVCNSCPNVQLEYYSNDNIKNLYEFLSK